MLRMTCPYCERDLNLDDARRGRPARCPHCGGAFRAPLEDGSPATGVAGAAAARADALAVSAAVVAVAGLILTVAAIVVRAYGGALPVGRLALRLSVLAPIGVVVVSWLVVGRAQRTVFVLVARFAAYLWILCLLILMLRLM
jgi:hypothetical protein